VIRGLFFASWFPLGEPHFEWLPNSKTSPAQLSSLKPYTECAEPQRSTSQLGQNRKLPRLNSMSVLPSIVLQKSQNAVQLIFREKTKQAASRGRCSFRSVAEVVCEFVAK
jgi:hypothetical protein